MLTNVPSNLPATANIKDSVSQQQQLPVVIGHDVAYNCWFSNLVKSIIEIKHERQQPFQHKTIVVTAGAWRMYDIHYESIPETETLLLDFYSIIRNQPADSTVWDTIYNQI